MTLDQKFRVMCRPAHGPRYCAMSFVPPKRFVVVRNAANEIVSLHRVSAQTARFPFAAGFFFVSRNASFDERGKPRAMNDLERRRPHQNYATKIILSPQFIRTLFAIAQKEQPAAAIAVELRRSDRDKKSQTRMYHILPSQSQIREALRHQKQGNLLRETVALQKSAKNRLAGRKTVEGEETRTFNSKRRKEGCQGTS